MTSPTASKPPDPLALLRTRRYVALLVLAAILGVPIAALAYFFLKLVDVLQKAVFTQLPSGLGFHGEPMWWPLLPLALAGLLVGLTIRYLPGKGGHSPADGLHTGGVVTPDQLAGADAGRGRRGGQLRRHRHPIRLAAAAAFLLMEAVGLGGAMLDVVLLPGLLAAGVGALIFVGLDTWTGFGTFSLAIPNLPAYSHPDLAQFGWALVIAPAAAVIGIAIRRLALVLRPHVERRLVPLMPVAGLAVAGLAIAFAAGTGKSSSEVLFSGQSALGPFIGQAASYSVGALLLLLACKSLAYSVSLSSFRGGPVFP